MRFLTDENIPKSIVSWLRATSHDVVHAKELGIGEPDTHWLHFARSNHRIILTSDKDFGDLVFRDQLASFGIVLLRLDDLPVTDWIKRLQEAWGVVEQSPPGAFVVITSSRVRVR